MFERIFHLHSQAARVVLLWTVFSFGRVTSSWDIYKLWTDDGENIQAEQVNGKVLFRLRVLMEVLQGLVMYVVFCVSLSSDVTVHVEDTAEVEILVSLLRFCNREVYKCTNF